MLTINLLKESEVADAADVIHTVYGKHREEAAREFSRMFKGEDHATYVFLARHNGTPIGTAATTELYFAFDVYCICWVGVVKEHREQGIATKLIETAEHFIKTELLKGKKGTIILSADLIDYYAKRGYTQQPSPMHDGSFVMMKIVNA